jgi:hypothetical protein
VKDGKEIPLEKGSELGNVIPHYSSKGNRFVYSYKKEDKYFLVVDDIKTDGYDEIHAPAFLSGENTYVFIGKKGGKDYLVIQSN